jgi:SAM-dependent methyltransferase
VECPKKLDRGRKPRRGDLLIVQVVEPIIPFGFSGPGPLGGNNSPALRPRISYPAALVVPIEQHQAEIQRNLRRWRSKPLLREIYAGFYERIVAFIDPRLPGRVVEIGSGIGNLKSRLPNAVATDLFSNPWLDAACDGYELPFRKQSLSHLVLFDVFHHLRAPRAFLREARRVLHPQGRLILFEPYVSMCSYFAYRLFHHEPLGLGEPIDMGEALPRPRDYYAAQANATRLFFRREYDGWPPGWTVPHKEAFSCFSYLLSGGYSKPSLYPAGCLGPLRWADRRLSRLPRLFAGRCLVVLRPQSQDS